MSVIIIISPPKKPGSSKMLSLGKTTSAMWQSVLKKVQGKIPAAASVTVPPPAPIPTSEQK